MNEDTFHLGIKAIIKNEKNEILLLRINPKKLIVTDDWKGEVYWDIPGGRIKKGDSVDETLRKEVEEETGIQRIDKIIPFTIVLANIRIPVKNNQTVGLMLSSYLCTVKSIKNIKLSDEHVEAKWFSPKIAAKNLSFKYPKEFTKKISVL